LVADAIHVIFLYAIFLQRDFYARIRLFYGKNVIYGLFFSNKNIFITQKNVIHNIFTEESGKNGEEGGNYILLLSKNEV
jgi:hypothetical protein